MLVDAIRICILSKADSFGGGASKCAEDLSVQLNHAGHKVRHYCYWSGKGYNATRYPMIGRGRKPVSFFREKFEKRVFGLPECLPIELPFLLKKGHGEFVLPLVKASCLHLRGRGKYGRYDE